MKLEAWLRQQHTLADRLLVVERLSQALNELHDRGEPLPALQPDRIEVAADGRCDLSEASHGAPAAGYAAPERAEGGLASPEADVYSAGAIAWEVLAGSPCGPSPTHLSEACPDLPQELADAVMACLERSPQWRPRDLTYLAQLAQLARGSRGKGPEAPAATARSARPAAARSARVGPGRGASDTSATTRLRLAIGGVLALAAAGGAVYLWSGRPADRAAATPRTVPPAASPNAPGAAAPATTLAATATAPPVLAASAPSVAPTPATAGAPPATTVARPTPTPTPAPTIIAAPAAAASDTAARAATPATSATAGSAAVPATAAAAPPPVAPSAPAVALPSASGQAAAGSAGPIAAPGVPLALSAVSPLSVRRPGKVLLDLRGAGMHDGIRVRVLPLREAPRGISIVRQKCEGDTLVRVLLDLDAQVAPAAYAIAIEDTDGRQTKPLTFTVTR